MSDKRNIPAIRFKGFSGEWEETSIASATTVNSGRDYKHLESGNIPVYGTGGYMLSVNQALSYNKDAIGIGRKGTIDKPYILRAPFWTVDTLFFVIPESNYNLDYIYGIFQKTDWKKRDESTGVPSLSKVAINNIEFYSPKNAEQQQIGRYFQNIDHLITQSTKRLEKLKNLKNAYLEKMFPRGGATTPELRFKGFSDEWERISLSNSEFDIIAGGDVDKNRLKTEGEYPVIANALIGDGIVGYYENSFRITAPAVTVTGRGDVGVAKARKMNFTPIVRLLVVMSPYDVDFLENAINLHKVCVESTGVPQLTVPQIRGYEIYIPKDINEQKKIGNFFRNIDEQIAKQTKKFDKLKNIKKACLDKMFV